MVTFPQHIQMLNHYVVQLNSYNVVSQFYFDKKLLLSSNNLKFSWENKLRMSKIEIMSTITVKFI